jgi:hypothetical protein
LIPRNSIQRVEEGGGGGGGQCLPQPGEVCADVSITAGATSFFGRGTVHFVVAAPLNFSLDATLEDVALGGVPAGILIGRFSEATAHVSVINKSANVTLTLTGPYDSGQTFTANGSAEAVQSQTACVTTATVTTTIKLNLQHLGGTTIVITYGVPCSP